jgi:hypothetical protein
VRFRSLLGRVRIDSIKLHSRRISQSCIKNYASLGKLILKKQAVRNECSVNESYREGQGQLNDTLVSLNRNFSNSRPIEVNTALLMAAYVLQEQRPTSGYDESPPVAESGFDSDEDSMSCTKEVRLQLWI